MFGESEENGYGNGYDMSVWESESMGKYRVGNISGNVYSNYAFTPLVLLYPDQYNSENCFCIDQNISYNIDPSSIKCLDDASKMCGACYPKSLCMRCSADESIVCD